MSTPAATSPPSAATAHAVVVVSNAVAYESFASRSLVERHIEILRRAGVPDVEVVSSSDWPHVEQAHAGWASRRLVLSAERVFDPRLYSAAISLPGGARFTDGGAAIGFDALEAGHPITSVDIETLPGYSRELRREIRPYWMRVESRRDRPAVARMLVEASGKGHQDLPAAVINAPIEKALMRKLADTSITPNQLTLLCNVVAYLVILLLARGYFLSGAIAAMVVGILDGLDGRQARVQIRTSTLGRVEHLLDKVYEILWMVALAYGLSSGFGTGHYGRGVLVWLTAYLADSAVYDVVKWYKGIQLDEVSSTDALIRLFAGRRNVYACILLGGALAGQPARAFTLILWWSLVTVAVHLHRAISIVVLGDDDSPASAAAS